jgi:hypothetical protein
VQVHIASWGRNFSIGTWAPGANPNGSTFTKADIIPIRSIDVVANPNDDLGVAIGVNKWLTFNITRADCPGLIFYCDSNATSVLTNTGGGLNTNESLNEIKVSGTWLGNPPVKQIGTAICSSQYNDFGTVAAVNDGNTGTGWSGGNAGGNSVLDWVALQFSKSTKVQKLDVFIYSWGKTIVVGYANSLPTAKTDFTVVRTIDITQTPLDDIGVPWARNTRNTILLPSNNAFAPIWGVWTNDSSANPLGVGGGGVDRVRMMELNMYSDGQAAPLPTPPGPNPKPPSGSPSVPFATTPAGWTRTEIAVNGSGTFTPDPYTTLIAVGLQGAGSGGRVNVSLTGQTTPNNATLNGGDTFISNASGVIARAPGGVGSAIPFASKFAGDIGTPCDWLRAVDNNGRAGATTAVGSNVGTAGGQSFINGVAGTAITLAAQDTNGAVTATTTFTGAAALPFTPTFVNAARNSGTGLTTAIALATAGTPTQTASIEFSFKGYAGQVVTLNFYHLIPNAQSSGTYKLNNDAPVPLNVSSGTTVSPSFPLSADGTQTIRFDLSTTATTGTIPRIQVSSMQLTGVGQAGGSSGASGRTAAFFFLPDGPFNYTVGKGGIGQAGGQTVTAATHGTRGSGGGTGGNGGDGVLVIYEYKSPLPLETAPQPLFATYNQILTTEVQAAYRSNYVGQASNVAGQGWGSQTAFTHKLRPRTKNVLVLMTGPGGQWRSSNPPLEPDQSLPTVLTSGSLSNTAESGWTGKTFGGSTGNGGIGGNMQDASNVLFGATGTTGGSTGNSTPNTSVIAGGYGSGGQSSYLSIAGGGCGGYGLVIIPASAFPADRTLSLLLGNTGTSASPGAIFLFETETENSPFITQLTESILRKEANAATAITQSAEQILLKNTNAATTVSQSVEQIIYKESESTNNLQVSHANIAFVVDADDPATAISQAAESVLIRSGPAQTLVTQSTEQVFMRTATLPFRITQMAELVFAAELPSIFWLNFGTIQYPLVKKFYDSQIGRATSVQPGAYIQLESPHLEGTTLVVNGVEVGLSSPIANNDQVLIRGGITNFYQTEMNVYTYYTKNGTIARELVGQWKFTREPLTPTHSRKYSVPYTNTNWIKTGNSFGLANIVSVWTQAKSQLGAVLSAAMASGRSALASLTGVFSKAMASMFGGKGAIVSQNNHATAQGAESIITKADAALSTHDAANTAAPHANLQAWDGYTQMQAGYDTVDLPEFERSFDHIDHYENVNFVGDHQVGFGLTLAVEYKMIGPVGYGTVQKEYEYNAVGKSYSSEQQYTAIYNSGSGKPFSMTAIGTIAYSVLVSTTYTKNSGVGTGNWLMPTGQADVAKTGFGFVVMNQAERAIAHPHLADRTVEQGANHNQGYFETSPIMHKVGFGNFDQTVVKSSVNSGAVDRIVIHTQHYLARANLTAYRPAEAISGRGKASLYMGFDTLQDVQDYTEQYSGVTTLAAYNGYVYNLAVDKSFVCEIYFNGPVSGLIQGG